MKKNTPYSPNMQHRLNFKIIGTCITFSFAALLLLQGYWLKDMYLSVKEQNRKDIQEAAEMADYKELFLRMHTPIVKKIFNNDLTFQYSQGFTSDTNAETKDSVSQTAPFDNLTEYLQFVEELPYYMLQSFHQSIDTLIPINYNNFDSLLTVELAQRNIHTKVVTQLYTNQDLANGIIPHTLQKEKNSEPYCFSYKKFSKAPQQYLFIYISNPDKQILAQMRGILITSGLVLLLIILTFVYLFRTILKQKTFEELKTDFTNNITHEFKTPIAVSCAAIDSLLTLTTEHNSTANTEGRPTILSTHHLPAEKINCYLTIAQRQLMHLTSLIEQLLAVAVENRTTFKLHPEPLLIAEIIQQLVEQYKFYTGKESLFTTEIPPDTEIIGDRTHLYNILNNLIENAIKYCNKPVVQINIKIVPLPDKTTITVSDNGIGIAPHNIKHIFEKFYRVPNGKVHTAKGYGLGLYYVKDMMERHDGKVSVQSTPGCGSQFTLTFKTESSN